MRKLLVQFTRFGLVGFVGLIVDFGVFNLLRATVFNPDHIHEGPVFAKVISTVLAIIVNWVGNRHWTFREHRGPQLVREGIQFGVVSIGGLLIGLLCLFVSHYLLGYTSVLADNISSNVIGLVLGTAFRFALYRLWVFAPRKGEPEPPVFTEPPTPSSRRGRLPQTAVSQTVSQTARPGTAPAGAAPQSD